VTNRNYLSNKSLKNKKRENESSIDLQFFVVVSTVSKIKEQNRLGDIIPKDDPALVVGLGGLKKPDKIMDVKEMSSFRRGKSKVSILSTFYEQFC
jgi:hypothetical protein